MIDTDQPAEPAFAPSHQFLDEAESQVYAAIALGRHLLAAPHPDRPIHEVRLWVRHNGMGLRIWAGSHDEASVQTWASLLDAPMDYRPESTEPEMVHCIVEGVFEGVPLHVWTIITVPITAAAIVENSTRVRVAYLQGGAKRSVDQPDRAAARQWIAEHAPKAVTG